MQEKSVLERLDARIVEIIRQYQTAKAENETLRNEIVTLKAQCEIKENELDKLRHDNANKDRELEEIVGKLESILS